MEARELMIGDKILNSRDEVITIYAPTHDGYTYEDENGDMCYGRCEISKPIPLTAEILEKNGFVRREDLVNGIEDSLPFFYVDDESGIDIVIEWRDSYDNGLRDENEQRWNEYWKVDINAIGEYTLTTRRIYVHELQHALRLCGIDKEIVL